MTVARKGVGALLIAYVILFALIAAALGVVLLGRDRSETVVSLRPANSATAAIPPASDTPAGSATRAIPPAPAAGPPPRSAEAPAARPAAPQTEPPAATGTEAVPAPAPDKPPPAPEPVPSRATLYPPPPPEKPAPPAPGADKPAATVAAAAGGSTPAALIEQGPYGPLPRIAPDGRLPWILNNSRFDHGTRKPRIGLIVTGLGLSPQVTEDAIVQLPAEITLAFVPYAPELQRWVALARQFGHEVLISLPLEGGTDADQGLGPRMLSTQASSSENLDRLRWVLSRASGYVGVVTWEGEKLLGAGQQIIPVLQEIAGRGLMVVDSRQARSNVVQQQADTLGLPFAKSRGFLDSEPGVAALDRNLQQLEALTQRAGFGVAMAVAFPDNLRRLVDWSRTVSQRGFVLAPITGVTECKDLCQQRVARHGAAVSKAGR
ncbi:MAG: divergent polysaccharide deacetylase family protein [Reyranellaceae bacterium]